MGLVVTLSPSEKFGDPLMTPAMEPSRFCFHFEMDGTPFGIFLEDLTGFFLPKIEFFLDSPFSFK